MIDVSHEIAILRAFVEGKRIEKRWKGGEWRKKDPSENFDFIHFEYREAQAFFHPKLGLRVRRRWDGKEHVVVFFQIGSEYVIVREGEFEVTSSVRWSSDDKIPLNVDVGPRGLGGTFQFLEVLDD